MFKDYYDYVKKRKKIGTEYNHIEFIGKKILNRSETNEYISQMIKSGTPCFAGRFGQTELQYVEKWYRKKYYGLPIPRTDLNQLCNNAGFFPNKSRYAIKYPEILLEAAQMDDLHAIWPLPLEDYVIDRYMKDAKLTEMGFVFPWTVQEKNEIPWTHWLSGKRVLVIHPFAETISNQYSNNREKIFSKLFSNPDLVLPKFDLFVIRAVQTACGNKDNRFNDWFEAYKWMINEIKKYEFDVAIIGCGAYGYPIGAEIKRMGKIAIQLCGATQLLFGVLGKRWEAMDDFMEGVVNEFWVRPNESERPDNFRNIENGCYW